MIKQQYDQIEDLRAEGVRDRQVISMHDSVVADKERLIDDLNTKIISLKDKKNRLRDMVRQAQQDLNDM